MLGGCISVLLFTKVKNACDKGVGDSHSVVMVSHASLVMSRSVSIF